MDNHFLDKGRFQKSLNELSKYFQSKGFTSVECIALCNQFVLIETAEFTTSLVKELSLPKTK